MNIVSAFKAEVKKVRHHFMPWATLGAFTLVPLMGAFFVMILRDPTLVQSSPLSAKAQAMAFVPDMIGYLSILAQAVAVGGVFVFGFVASWIFGREYSDGTATDLLSLPVSRSAIVNAKFLLYVLWCIGLSLSNLLIGMVIANLLGLPLPDSRAMGQILNTYFITIILTVPLGTVVSFFAMAGRGYLAPLGFVALTIFLAQVIAATGFGHYFPWSIPGIFSGTGDLRATIGWYSFVLVAATGLLGYLGCLYWLNRVDQT